MRISSVIVILMLGVCAGAEFKIGLPEAQAQFVATSNRHSTGDAKQSAQISKLSSENQKRLNENQVQDVSLTAIASCGNAGRIYGPTHPQAASNCINSVVVNADGSLTAAGNISSSATISAQILVSNGGVQIGSATNCTSSTEGTLRYKSSAKAFEFCDGSSWQGLAAAGSGGGCDYNFTEVSDATTSTYYTSNQPSINGFSGTQIAVLSGDPTATIIKNGNNTGLQSISVQNFDNIGIRVQSSDNYSRAVNTALKIGDNYLTCWSVRTKDQDVVPNAFVFNDLTGQELDTLVTSNVVTLDGFDGPLAVVISGQGSPRFRINGGSAVTSGDIYPGDTLQLQMTTSANYETSHASNYQVGTATGMWAVTTRPECGIVNGVHTCDQCTAAGGVVYAISGPNDSVCRFSGSSCPSGWVRHENWTTTTAKTCGLRSANSVCGSPTSKYKTTLSHAWANIAPETTSGRLYGQWCGSACGGEHCRWRNFSCTANIVEVGCY